MNWHTAAGWAFGFFTPVIVVLIIGLAITAFGGWFSLPDGFKLNPYHYWSGGWVLVGLCILGCVAAFHYFP